MPRSAGVGSLLDIALDESSALPLFQQLYADLRQRILSARLKPGEKLPASRSLARDLGISRNTVLSAFDQLLSEGYLEMRGGSGTFVASDLPDWDLPDWDLPDWDLPDRVPEAIAPRNREAVPQLAQRSRIFLSAPQGRDRSTTGPLTPCFTPGWIDSSDFPFALWSRLLAKSWRHPMRSVVDGGDPGGYPPLREAIANYLRQARGINCAAEDVLIVSGIRQAVDLTCRLLLDPGDKVWVERPGFPGIGAAIAASGGKLVHVPVDAEGLDVDRGLSQAPSARLACVAPSHQYPLGVVMSLQRRLSLLAWARAAKAWVLEDDYDSEFRYAGRPLAALRSLDADGRVIYVGTLSKMLFPSLRIGYLVAPPALAASFRRARGVVDDQPAMASQPALAEFFSSGHLAAYVRRMRLRYARRQELLLEAAERHLGGKIVLRPDVAGLHLVGRLATAQLRRQGDVRIAEKIATGGVTVSPLSDYDVSDAKLRGEPITQGLMFGYAAVPEAKIEPGVRAIARTLKL